MCGDCVDKAIKDYFSLLGKLHIKTTEKSRVCLICRGSKLLCGKNICPIIIKAKILFKKSNTLKKTVISGSTPPGIFVGSNGYPDVYSGPVISDISGNTEILDTPELWVNKSISEIINYRFSLIRANFRINVQNIENNKFIYRIHEALLSKGSVDTETYLKKPPSGNIILSDSVQPIGPSAPVEKFIITPGRTEKNLERVYYDTDLKSRDAIIELYKKGLRISTIQKVLSAGMLGIRRSRKLVPTRWSITAVDSLISKYLIDRAKDRWKPVGEYRVYYWKNLDNIYVSIITPEKWCFEWIEAWFPSTTWNPRGKKVEIMADHEDYEGRTTYPDIGGCYFSTRLAVGELFEREKIQGGVLVMREIHPGFMLPLGVWNVRENIRKLFSQKPQIFDNFRDAFNTALAKLTIKEDKWLKHSWFLKRNFNQRKLDFYF